MNIWVVFAGLAVAAGAAVQALNVGDKLRLTFAIAHWSAFFWVGLRIVVFSTAQVIA